MIEDMITPVLNRLPVVQKDVETSKKTLNRFNTLISMNTSHISKIQEDLKSFGQVYKILNTLKSKQHEFGSRLDVQITKTQAALERIDSDMDKLSRELDSFRRSTKNQDFIIQEVRFKCAADYEKMQSSFDKWLKTINRDQDGQKEQFLKLQESVDLMTLK